MQKRLAVLTLLVFVIMLVVGCEMTSPPADEQAGLEKNKPSVNERTTLAGIGLGDSTADVEQTLGEDYSSESLHPDGSWFGEPTSRWLYGNAIEVIIGEESNTVLQINLYGDGYSTSDGDKVGDQADQVFPAYEEKYPLAKDHFEDNELPGWFVVEEGEWLIFNFKDDDTMVNQSIASDDQVKSIHLVYEKFMH